MRKAKSLLSIMTAQCRKNDIMVVVIVTGVLVALLLPHARMALDPSGLNPQGEILDRIARAIGLFKEQRGVWPLPQPGAPARVVIGCGAWWNDVAPFIASEQRSDATTRPGMSTRLWERVCVDATNPRSASNFGPVVLCVDPTDGASVPQLYVLMVPMHQEEFQMIVDSDVCTEPQIVVMGKIRSRLGKVARISGFEVRRGFVTLPCSEVDALFRQVK